MPVNSQVLLIAGVIVLGVVVVLGAGVLIFSYRQARSLLTPVRKPLELRPDDVGLTVEDLWITGPRGKLAAW